MIFLAWHLSQYSNHYYYIASAFKIFSTPSGSFLCKTSYYLSSTFLLCPSCALPLQDLTCVERIISKQKKGRILDPILCQSCTFLLHIPDMDWNIILTEIMRLKSLKFLFIFIGKTQFWHPDMTLIIAKGYLICLLKVNHLQFAQDLIKIHHP